ncbi:MarR family winged helix-turn-helix transcriptional regulator [Streptomyces sp. NPDC002690]
MHQSSCPSEPTDEQRIECAARGLLRSIGRLAQTLFRNGDFGLTRSQVAVLDALEAGPRRVTSLAAYTGTAQPRVTVVLQGLEERGLVARDRCAFDRRAVEASLTPAGRQVLDEGSSASGRLP